MTRSRTTLLAALVACTAAPAWGAPAGKLRDAARPAHDAARTTQAARVATAAPTRVGDQRPELAPDVQREFAEAGYTLESLAATSPFAQMHPELFNPAAQPSLGPIEHRPPWVPEGEAWERPETIMPQGAGSRVPRGFVQLPPWRDGEVLYRFSDEIVDLFLDPPDEPSANEANSILAVSNASFVFFYVQQVTEQRIKFIGYDPQVHSDDGFVLIEANGPENVCFDAAIVGYQAALDGQFFSVCQWNSFGTVVSIVGFTLGLEREHQRRDRDQFVRVNLQNVGSADIFGNGVSDFVILTDRSTEINAYDYGSVMHFPSFQSSFNGLPTIEVKRNPARQWLLDNPIVEQNLAILYPDIVLAAVGSPAYEVQIVDALEAAMGTGGAFSDGDIETIYALYGRPGEPYPWVFDPVAGCPADINRDGRMTSSDLLMFLGMVQSGSIFADLDGDGDADGDDFIIFRNAWTPGFCQVPYAPDPPLNRPIVGFDDD